MPLIRPRRSILQPRRGMLSYPGTRAGFDPGHLVADGIRYSGVPIEANFLNLLSGLPAIRSSSSTVVGRPDGVLGPTFTYNNGGVSITVPNQSTDNDTRLTVAWIWRPTIIANGPMFCNDGLGTNGFYVGSSGGGGASGRMLFQAIQPNTFRQANANCDFASGMPLFSIISMDGTTTMNMVQRNLETGVVKTFVTTGVAPTAPSGTYRIGSAAGAHMNNALLAAVMLSSRYHPMSNLLKWADDPWSFWYPVQ